MELQPIILGAAASQPLFFGAILAVFARVIDRRERGRHDELKVRIDRFEDRFDRESRNVRDEFNQVRGELGQIRADIASVRSDITQVALAVGIQTRPQTG